MENRRTWMQAKKASNRVANTALLFLEQQNEKQNKKQNGTNRLRAIIFFCAVGLSP
jgi:hypothetical protein